MASVADVVGSVSVWRGAGEPLGVDAGLGAGTGWGGAGIGVGADARVVAGEAETEAIAGCWPCAKVPFSQVQN